MVVGAAATELLSISRHKFIASSSTHNSFYSASSAVPLTSRNHSTLIQIRHSNGYISRYRTFGPAKQPLVSFSQPKTTQAFPASLPKQSSTSYNPKTNSGDDHSSTQIDDDAWAFGGGQKSQGGPAQAAKEPTATRLETKAVPIIVTGNAGKGATLNYGKRRKDFISFGDNVEFKVTEASVARNYEYKYSPSTRSEHPLPQHVYFSSPPSSSNPSSFIPPTVQPSLGGGASSAGVGQGYSGSTLVRKKTALIMPGQGSQYVSMSKDLYKSFRSARTVWHQAEEALMLTPGHNVHNHIRNDRALTREQRQLFEAALEKSSHLDTRRGLSASGTAVARGRRGWLRDLVFSGDQLQLIRAENAQPAILTCSLAFLQVLRKEFSVDLIRDHVSWSAGHGSGVYAALVGAGAIDLSDAVRMLRHRGLMASHYTANNPILFPPGCTLPENIYETWAFSNVGSGKGVDLLGTNSDSTGAALDSASPPQTTKRGWKRTQMSGVVVRPGKLKATLAEVEQVARDIKEGRVPSVARDEVVEAANVNSQLQIVLSGSRVGVSYCCDRLRSKSLGARAVNLPVSGAYHTSLMKDAVEFLTPSVQNLPIQDPQGFSLVSSMDGSILQTTDSIRKDLGGALARPVQWLSSIETLLAQGVERFICLGPGRACAHLLSKELAYRDRQSATNGEPSTSAYEVWSLATVEDVIQLGEALSSISLSEGVVQPPPTFDADRIIAD